MQVDSWIELGRDDPALEFPWASEDGKLRYQDLKHDPALIEDIPEAGDYPDLRDFLLRINGREFPLQTVKTDIWMTDEISPEDEVFGGRQKIVCYVDLIFTGKGPRLSLQSHLQLVEKLCSLLQRAPEIAASVEFVVRRCYYHELETAGCDPRSGSLAAGRSAEETMTVEQVQDSQSGFCITAYVSGFGDTDEEAQQRWSIALKLLQHALVQAAHS